MKARLGWFLLGCLATTHGVGCKKSGSAGSATPAEVDLQWPDAAPLPSYTPEMDAAVPVPKADSDD